MTDAPKVWRCLVVDDDEDFCRQIREYLDAKGLDDESALDVVALTDFEQALSRLASGRFDVVILDVRLGTYDQEPEEEAGVALLRAIRERCFVPIVFYTGLPRQAPEPQSPFVTVVEKSRGVEQLRVAIREVFDTQLPTISRALYQHLEDTQREYMWDFLADNWDLVRASEDKTAIAYLLARRLSVSLSGTGIRRFIADLGGNSEEAGSEGRVHPMRYYLIPPVEATYQACDILRGQVDGTDGYWVLLTPSCDMDPAHEKAEWVLLARCHRLEEQPEYTTWRDASGEQQRREQGRLESLLRNNRQRAQQERFYYLPGALDLPDLVVDLQDLASIPRPEIDHLSRLASLDTPYCAALLGRFTRYIGRHGSADLDVDMVMRRLQVQESTRHQLPPEKSN